MTNNLAHLKSARDAAQAEVEALDARVREIRDQLTRAQREAKKARAAFESARLKWVEAMEAAR